MFRPYEKVDKVFENSTDLVPDVHHEERKSTEL